MRSALYAPAALLALGLAGCLTVVVALGLTGPAVALLIAATLLLLPGLPVAALLQVREPAMAATVVVCTSLATHLLVAYLIVHTVGLSPGVSVTLLASVTATLALSVLLRRGSAAAS